MEAVDALWAYKADGSTRKIKKLMNKPIIQRGFRHDFNIVPRNRLSLYSDGIL
jgi:hypothetical protein